MNLKNIQYLLHVAQTENISRSARELFIAQPALSRLIADAEKELGYPLFDRYGKRIVLNQNGTIFIDHARQILAEWHDMGRELDESNHTPDPHLSVGVEACSQLLPSILQQSTVSIGMMLVQSVVNGFGPEVLAGYSAAIRIDSLVTVPLGAVGNAMSPYTAQNIGAGRTDRIRKGYRIGLILIAISGIITLLILITLNTQIIGLFLGAEGTAAAYGTGEHYISFLCWFYTILGAALVTGGVLRGMGRMRLFALASIANLTFRVIGSMVLAPRFGVEVVWYVVPVGWSLYFGICYAAYRVKRRSAP